jgi:hypothetical protein
MTTDTSATAQASVPSATSTAARPASKPAPPSWPWMRGALVLAGAAQLITISALTSADPLAATWWSLLLAIAPAPLVAAAAFTPVPANRLLAVAGSVVLLIGIVGGITHISLFFVPALVILVVGAVKLWRESS